MKFEEAFFYKNLLVLGYEDSYDDYLTSYLESEDPLSDIVLELSFCSSDVEKTISLLHDYCANQPLDEFVVCDRWRLFFREEYSSNRISKDKMFSDMYRLAVIICDSGDFDIHNISLWGSIYFLEDFYCLVKDGIISRESFDEAFFSYLNNGTPIDFELIWRKNMQKKPSLFERLKRFFKHGTD